MAEKLFKKTSHKVEPKKSAVEAPGKIVLVGTYKEDQLEKWPGYYNYPLTEKDAFDEDSARKVNEIWLFKGAEEGRFFAAEYVGTFTREELAEKFGYPAKGKAHAQAYLLYRIGRTEVYNPADGVVDAVIVRAADFAKRSPKVARQIKAYLESPERRDPVAANLVPKILTQVPRPALRVCDPLVQTDWIEMLNSQTLHRAFHDKKCLVSLFSGAGGLDLGFEQAGFSIEWANEFDKDIWETYSRNHPTTYLSRKSICDVDASEVPDCVGIIGGPPCQSWSEGGARRGIKDKRGQLFFDYIRILKAKRPLFFLAENVSGMLLKRHKSALTEIKKQFAAAGYNLSLTPVNAWEYGAPQDRERVLFVGYRSDLGKTFKMPEPLPEYKRKNIRDAIGDLEKYEPHARKNGLVDANSRLPFPNHEYMTGGFSSIFMSRNRVRAWDEPAFTVQAGGRQSQLHPSAPKMVKEAENRFVFKQGYESSYRRLTVREAARIQTFPDDFIFYYRNIAHGYKMIGNAVPVVLAKVVAEQIMRDLHEYL